MPVDAQTMALLISVQANVTQANTALTQLRTNLQGVGTAASAATPGITQMAGALNTVGLTIGKIALGNLGAMLTMNIAGMFVKSAEGAEDFAMHAAKLQRETGATAESASGLLAVFNRFGVNMASTSRGLAIFDRQLNQARLTTERAGGTTNVFRRLTQEMGIALNDATGNFRAEDQILMDLADRFQSMPDGIEKTAMAQQLFGRSGRDLLWVLNQGRAGIEAAQAAASEYGLVLSQNSIQKVQQFKLAQQDAQQAVNGLALEIAMVALPPIANLTRQFAQGIVNIRGWAAALKEDAGNAITDFASKLGGLPAQIAKNTARANMPSTGLLGPPEDTDEAESASAAAQQAMKDAEELKRAQGLVMIDYQDKIRAAEGPVDALRARIDTLRRSQEAQRLEQERGTAAIDDQIGALDAQSAAIQLEMFRPIAAQLLAQPATGDPGNRLARIGVQRTLLSLEKEAQGEPSRLAEINSRAAINALQSQLDLEQAKVQAIKDQQTEYQRLIALMEYMPEKYGKTERERMAIESGHPAYNPPNFPTGFERWHGAQPDPSDQGRVETERQPWALGAHPEYGAAEPVVRELFNWTDRLGDLLDRYLLDPLGIHAPPVAANTPSLVGQARIDWEDARRQASSWAPGNPNAERLQIPERWHGAQPPVPPEPSAVRLPSEMTIHVDVAGRIAKAEGGEYGLPAQLAAQLADAVGDFVGNLIQGGSLATNRTPNTAPGGN